MTSSHKALRVLVLGAAGMLGHTLLRYFTTRPGLIVSGAVRRARPPAGFPSIPPEKLYPNIDVGDEAALRAVLEHSRAQVVINCAGLVKQRPESHDAEQAVRTNALAPHLLSRLSAEHGARLIHFSTDCVFNGRRGLYREDDAPDCEDLYGRSKLLGEVVGTHALTLRTSMIGPELSAGSGLLSWFLSRSGPVPGYRRAVFSGLPTVELARVLDEFVLPDPALHGLYHVGAEPISKYELLELVRTAYDSPAVPVPDDATVIDRSLDSSRFRARTGYTPPDWPTLVHRMKEDC